MNKEAIGEQLWENTTVREMATKIDRVKDVFENVPRYLDRQNVDIRVRAKTVKVLSSLIKWRRLLDIGCGDGSISLPLVTPEVHLTMLDLSSSMAAITKAKVPEELSGNVVVKNENFMTASFHPGSFDLIVSVGVLAHVDSPDEFISRIQQLLVPGGSLIVEFTDCRHVVGRFGRFLGSLTELLKPAKYPTNRLSFSEMAEIFNRHNLQLMTTFRYATIPIPGVSRVVSQQKQFSLVERMFGTGGQNKNAYLGNEYICWLTAR